MMICRPYFRHIEWEYLGKEIVSLSLFFFLKNLWFSYIVRLRSLFYYFIYLQVHLSFAVIDVNPEFIFSLTSLFFPPYFPSFFSSLLSSPLSSPLLPLFISSCQKRLDCVWRLLKSTSRSHQFCQFLVWLCFGRIYIIFSTCWRIFKN